MHARGIDRPGGQHVFAVFQRHAVMMVNEQARFVIVKIFVAARLCAVGVLMPSGGGTRSAGATAAAGCGVEASGAGGRSRLLTITQRTYSTIIS